MPKTFATTKTDTSALAPKASPTFTGTVTLPVGLTGVIRTDVGVVSVDTDVTDIVAAASTTAQGKVELATDAETNTGTDTARAITPSNLEAWTGSAQITTVGTLASPAMTTPALGTPSALVGTNISGTAANLTAGTVTTNADLTGDVTSSGNATTIAWTRNPYCFRAYASGATTLTDATIVQILLATEVYDYNNNFASSTYTAPFDGVYHFDGAVTNNGAFATGVNFMVTIYNGVAEASRGSNNATIASMTGTVSCDLLLAAGDAITLRCYQDSAGNEATLTGATLTYFCGHLVHRTA